MLSVLTYVVSENAPFSTKYFLILLMSAFFLAKKISVFWQKWYLYSKQYCVNCARDCLIPFSGFVRQKVTINENIGQKSEK